MSVSFDSACAMQSDVQFYYMPYTTKMYNKISSNKDKLQNDYQHKALIEPSINKYIAILQKEDHVSKTYYESKSKLLVHAPELNRTRASYNSFFYIPQHYIDYRFFNFLYNQVPLSSKKDTPFKSSLILCNFKIIAPNYKGGVNNASSQGLYSTNSRLYMNRLVKNILLEARLRNRKNAIKTRFCRCAVA